MLTHTAGAGARARVRAAVALTIVAALAACGTDPVSPGPVAAPDVTGGCALPTVNGQPPATLLCVPDTLTVQDGRIAAQSKSKRDSRRRIPGVPASRLVDAAN